MGNRSLGLVENIIELGTVHGKRWFTDHEKQAQGRVFVSAMFTQLRAAEVLRRGRLLGRPTVRIQEVVDEKVAELHQTLQQVQGARNDLERLAPTGKAVLIRHGLRRLERALVRQVRMAHGGNSENSVRHTSPASAADESFINLPLALAWAASLARTSDKELPAGVIRAFLTKRARWRHRSQTITASQPMFRIGRLLAERDVRQLLCERLGPPKLRRFAARVRRTFGLTPFASTLTDFVVNPETNAAVKLVALAGLGIHGTPEHIGILKSVAAESNEDGHREVALWALAAISPREARELLVREVRLQESAREELSRVCPPSS